MRILVIEDEKRVANFIKHGLEQERYIVETASDGISGLELAMNAHFEAILLDIMLPGKDGFSILKELRNLKISTPVMILSARGTTEDRVRGLDLGADDYLPKPFSFEELAARLRAILRRSIPEKSTRLSCGYVTLDTVLHLAFLGDKELDEPLTQKEYLLLEYLMRNKNRVLSRANITQQVWKHDFEQDSNIIDVYIKRLRNKIEIPGSGKPLIQSIRGVGYRMRDIQQEENE